MEGTLNKAVTYLISIVIFFIYPVYITYEKKDDITHALVSKATHLFVDNIRTKGYISQGMINDYMNLINSTGNRYDINFLHTKKRYDPVVYFYGPVTKGNGEIAIEITDELSHDEFEPLKDQASIRISSNNGVKSYRKNERISANGETYYFEGWKETTKVSKEYFSNDVINNKIAPKFMDAIAVPGTATNEEKAGNVIPETSDLRKYKMSVGDTFEVSVRNENTTISSMLFATLTGRRADTGIPRIFIKYGGVIRNEVVQTTLTDAYAIGEEPAEEENPTPGQEGEAPTNVEQEVVTSNSPTTVKFNNSNSNIGKEYNFTYIGVKEQIDLEPGTYRIIAAGAQGGGSTDKDVQGGLGGVTEGVLKLTEKTKLYVNVGSVGVDAKSKYNHNANSNKELDKINLSGGYNGGGNSSGIAGAGGGGATEVTFTSGEPLMVAAGGGGNTYSNSDTYKLISAGGNKDSKNLMQTKNGESACIVRHVSNYENDEAGAGAGYKGGRVIHGDNPRCSYGGSNYINTNLFMSNTNSAGINKGNGSVKIIRIN